MSIPPSPALSSARGKRRALLRKIVTRTFWVAVIAAMLTVFWALWYVSHRGFSSKWRRTLTEELAKRGVHITFTRLTLNPLQGLVARDVRIRESRDDGRAMAVINEVVLDINYSNLVHHESFLNAIELRNATVSLPLAVAAGPRGPQLPISHLNARILFPPHHLDIQRAEARVRGLHIGLTGHFVNPEQLQMPHRAPSDSHPLDRLREILDRIESLGLSGGRPMLELNVSGDLARPSSLFVEGLFTSGSFTLKGEKAIESVRIAATLSEGIVRLDQCEITDRTGSLEATGSYQIGTGEAFLQARSTLDLPSLIHAVDPACAVNELVLYREPVLEISASGSFRNAKSLSLYGRFSTGRFSARSLVFEGAEADFSLDSPDLTKQNLKWYLHGARIRHKDGEFRLNAMQVPGDFRFNLDSQINPAVFLPLLPGEAREKLAEWEFRTAPVIHMEGFGTKCDPQAVEFSGQAQLGATKAHGVPLKSVSAQLGFKGNVLTIGNIKLERTEGSASGTVAYDFNTEELQFKNVRTTINPAEVVRIFDRELSDNLAPYRFKTHPPSLLANGKVDCARGRWSLNHLRIEVDGPQGMDYTFLGKNLAASRITGVVSVVGDRLKLDNLDATLFGGRLRGKADISLRKAAGDYTAELYTEAVDFPSLTKLYFDFDTSQGKLYGAFNFSGVHDSARDIDGKGNIYIADGNVFAIPIFGPFSGILNEVLPGTGYNVARKGTCNFQMRDGVVSTEDLVMEGRGFSILGRGKLFILEDRMDFFARINAQGLPGKVLTPISHLLEYVSDGSLMKPAWRPRRLPKIIFPYNPPHPNASPSGALSPSASPGAAPVGTPATPAPVGSGTQGIWQAPWRAVTRGIFTPRSGR
ncbi:MAG: AsmA-like C-terminal region-containing protein [Chthoniobacteraceae bacterium]